MSFFPTVTQRFVAYNQKVENNLLIIEGDIVKINTILFEKWFFGGKILEKQEIRRQVKEKKKLLTREEVEEYSERIASLFCNLEEYKNASVILPYLAYNTEINTNKIIERAWSDGKTVAVPKVTGEGRMDFFEIKSFDQIEIGFCNIPEPKIQFCKAARFDEALMIMPGLAFGKDHTRIGYGGGYYDRYIEKAEENSVRITKISLAYDFQVFDTLEVERHDKKVDLVVTAKEIF